MSMTTIPKHEEQTPAINTPSMNPFLVNNGHTQNQLTQNDENNHA